MVFIRIFRPQGTNLIYLCIPVIKQLEVITTLKGYIKLNYMIDGIDIHDDDFTIKLKWLEWLREHISKFFTLKSYSCFHKFLSCFFEMLPRVNAFNNEVYLYLYVLI